MGLKGRGLPLLAGGGMCRALEEGQGSDGQLALAEGGLAQQKYRVDLQVTQRGVWLLQV